MATLSVRAQRILADLGVSTPQELHRLKLPPWVGSLESHILRTPNCGRKTLREIMEWGASGKRSPDPMPSPPTVYIRWVWENDQWHLVGYSTDAMSGRAWARYDATPAPREEPTND